jgi:restriction system protein
MSQPKHAWMVRSGNDNQLVDQVESKSAVAIGWAAMGDLSDLKSREDFKARYQNAYPEHSSTRVAVNAGQIYRFCREIKPGDYILTYDKAARELLVGIVEGSYAHLPELFSPEYPNVHRVQWMKRTSRDAYTIAARNSMGSVLTVFQIDDYIGEIYTLVTDTTPVAQTEQIVEATETPPFYEETKAKADELIADLVSQLDPYDFQDLVAAVLRAMGFRAVSSKPGRDQGIDIVAHPDYLGFERPRIKVQVKHRDSAAGGPEMRSFFGTLRAGENGLFVSTGGFTRDAQIEAERAREPVTCLDRDGFIRLMLEHYEALEPEFKAQIPLRRMWVPAQ